MIDVTSAKIRRLGKEESDALHHLPSHHLSVPSSPPRIHEGAKANLHQHST